MQEEKQKLRNFTNALSGEKKQFTWDYDGRLMIQQKLKKKKLPPVNPKSSYQDTYESAVMNE